MPSAYQPALFNSSEIYRFDAAKALSPFVRFGGSSWVYPGWKDKVYHRAYSSKADFSARSFEEYVQFPWFRTVGIDSGFYQPLSSEKIKEMDAVAPLGFQWVAKASEVITAPIFPQVPRSGDRAGQRNETFLSAPYFVEQVLAPYYKADAVERLGAVVFQFPQIQQQVLDARSFFARLAEFLKIISAEQIRCGIEVRNPEFLCPEYFDILNTYSVTHCFNHWTYMPSLREQMIAASASGGLEAPFYIARILTPRGVTYEQAVERFSPYSSLQCRNLEMRQDVTTLARRAIKRNVTAFIIVNNRCEGHSPGTISEIGGDIVAGSGMVNEVGLRS